MLEIKNISKKYTTTSLTQTALNNVSLNFRDSEFVAILGQSGSGKTTLLNVIGGLDRYDSGELIIDGKTTKQYKDKDWDYYRNHTIGFVFQSYNLISHQSILANVELALTISGINGKEKRVRAENALQQVGLFEHRFKKPSELSGGQMQRVAIARALVNDPRIILADEPTGALDSKTSIQVMELLKQASKDRLVIMVTHNPELASKYATRTVEIQDGNILNDTNPFFVAEEVASFAKKGKSAMSFFTALQLSFQNLKTKKTRTTLVSMAGSIGIIGIALILSLSSGVQAYIDKTEKETMAQYPLDISSAGFNIDDMIASRQEKKDISSNEGVTVMNTLSYSIGQIHENDLSSLKSYLEDHQSELKDKVQTIEYNYGVTPAFFQLDNDKAYSMSVSTGSQMPMMMYDTTSTIFNALPSKSELYQNDYDLKAGKWPTTDNELLLILNQDGQLSDTALYELGIKSRDEYKKITEAMKEDKAYKIEDDTTTYAYDKFFNLTFYALANSDIYAYNNDLQAYTNQSENSDYIKTKLPEGKELHIVGIIQPKNTDTPTTSLSTGIGYMPTLNLWAIDRANASVLVQKQLSDKTIDVFTGEKFDQENSDVAPLDDPFSSTTMPSLDFSNLNLSLPNISSSDIQTLLSSIQLHITKDDLTNLLNSLYSSYQSQNTNIISSFQQNFQSYLTTKEFQEILSSLLNSIIQNNPSLSPTSLQEMMNETMSNLNDYIKENPTSISDPSKLLQDYLTSSMGQEAINTQSQKLISSLSQIKIDENTLKLFIQTTLENYNKYASTNQLVTTKNITDSFANFIQSEQAQSIVYDAAKKAINLDALSTSVNTLISDYSNQVMSQIGTSIQDALSAYMESIMGNMNLGTSSIANLLKMNNAGDITSLLSNLENKSAAYENNLKTLGYADTNKPSSISIYPKDFTSKQFIKDFLDTYNKTMQDEKQLDKVIVYTDFVATMMSEISKIIDTISYVLIAFVAISLVVSSLMIGVITYISVLERRKEIGILRALGASKHNITQVFNAETFITGLFAGILGIVITLLLLIPINQIIHTIAETTNVSAYLPPIAGIFLIILSIILTLIAGLIPSKKAAKSDPVAALKSE